MLSLPPSLTVPPWPFFPPTAATPRKERARHGATEDLILRSVVRPMQAIAENRKVAAEAHMERSESREAGLCAAVVHLQAQRLYIGVKSKYGTSNPLSLPYSPLPFHPFSPLLSPSLPPFPSPTLPFPSTLSLPYSPLPFHPFPPLLSPSLPPFPSPNLPFPSTLSLPYSSLIHPLPLPSCAP
ncbi:unnamed protein product [Closterium sp. NIES-65]|nr:unnamed protein product [Closterium sp. NIES-65]